MASKGSFPFPCHPLMFKDSPVAEHVNEIGTKAHSLHQPHITNYVNTIVDHNASIEKSLDFYFQVCSTEVNCRQVAALAATYANCGVNPLTGSEKNQKTTQQLH